MSDYGTMQARIANEIDDDSLTDEIKNAIQSAITHHSRKKFWFNQVRFDFAIVADDEYFDSTDDTEIPNLLQIDSAWLVDSSSIRYELVQVNDSIITAAQNGLVKQRPTNLSYVRKQLRCFPISDASYTCYVEGWSRLSALSLDADTNAWMVEAEELIRQRAKYILAVDIIGDEAMALRARGAESEALDALEYETFQRRGQQFLSVDPALVPCREPDITTGDV